MNWINIHVETLRGSEFVGAEPVERATWISLMGWSCSQENSGRIENCKDWTSRKWQQLCGITLEEVQMKSELYKFEGEDLIVHFYPMDQQESVEAKRRNGKRGGRPKKISEPVDLTQQGDKPHGSGLLNLEETTRLTKTEPSDNLKEKESKEKESKVMITPTLEEFIEYLLVELPKINPQWMPEQIARACNVQFDTYVDQDWFTGGNKPRKIKNWKTTAKNSMKHLKPWNFGSAPQQQSTPVNYARTL